MVETRNIPLIDRARELKREPSVEDIDKAVPILSGIFEEVARLTEEHGYLYPQSGDQNWQSLAVRIVDPNEPPVTVILRSTNPKDSAKSAEIEVRGIRQALYVFKSQNGEIEGKIKRATETGILPIYSQVGLEGALQYQAVIERVQQELGKKSSAS